MRKFLVIIFITSLFSFKSTSQTHYPIFKDSSTFQQGDSGKLILEIDNLNYLRNYEYFGKIPLSYTLLGYQFIPQLKYQLNSFFSLKGGVFLRREFGKDGFVTATPVLTAKYQKKGLSFILGTLEGSLNHQFIEPVYDFESIISDRIEQGAQVIIDRSKLWLDWYIDWEKAIERNSSYPEEFTTGMSSRTHLLNKERFKMDLPLQAMVAHKGGQIDTSHTPVESLLNTAVGASFTFFPASSFLQSVISEHYFVYYRDISGTKAQLFNEGKAYYGSVTFKTKWHLDIDARYWKGSGFHGPRGGALYSSISEKIPGYGEKIRELIFLSVIYDKQLFDNVFLDLRLDPYYDVRNKKTEYAYSVFFRFKKDFLLKRIK